MQRKRFNIWVAYSDLFSNLAVFLFISAFGVFAAIGSLSNSHQPGCSAPPKDVGDMLTSKSASGQLSGLTLHAAGSVSACSAYYDLSGYPPVQKRRHHKPAVAPGDTGGPAPAPDAYRHVCEQIWGATTRADMASRGQITIVGTIGSNAGLTCPDAGTDPDKTGLSWEERMHEVDCWLESPGHGSKDPNCRTFIARHSSDCFSTDDASMSPECLGLMRRWGRDDYRRTECLKPVAAAQVENLYRTCRDALLDDRFKWKLIWTKGSILTAREENYVLLDKTWNGTVKYRGEVSATNQNGFYLEVRADGGPGR